MDIIYRSVTAQDTEALAELGRSSFVGAFAHLYTPENLNMFLQTAYSAAAVAQEVASPDRLYHVAELDGALIGYCKLKRQTGFNAEIGGDLKERKILDLAQLYLHSDMTGKGIGDALMQWALGYAKSQGYDDILLSVFSENYGGQRFYARYGFTKYSDFYFMVGDHRDEEYLYRLQLTD